MKGNGILVFSDFIFLKDASHRTFLAQVHAFVVPPPLQTEGDQSKVDADESGRYEHDEAYEHVGLEAVQAPGCEVLEGRLR